MGLFVFFSYFIIKVYFFIILKAFLNSLTSPSVNTNCWSHSVVNCSVSKAMETRFYDAHRFLLAFLNSERD